MSVRTSAGLSRRLAKSILQQGFWPALVQDHLIRRLARLPPPSRDSSFSPARSARDLDAAFALVYQAYLREGLTPKTHSQRRITLFHALPSTAVLVARTGGDVTATVTLIRDGALGLPADQLADLSPFRGKGKPLAEISSLALAPDIRGRSTGLLFHLIRYMIHFSQKVMGVRRFVIAVHPRHLPLYRGLFLFSPLPGPVRFHSFANHAPAVLAVRDLDTAPADFRQVYAGQPRSRDLSRFIFGPFSAQEARTLPRPTDSAGKSLTPEMLDLFFRQKTRLFAQASPETLAAIRQAYPEPGYGRILASPGFSQEPAHPAAPLPTQGGSHDIQTSCP